jgi:hypothetical protein
MHSRSIASVEFADGVTRLVYEDAHGQYVLDDQGEAWYGVWYVSREELETMFGDRPIIVSGNDEPRANP